MSGMQAEGLKFREAIRTASGRLPHLLYLLFRLLFFIGMAYIILFPLLVMFSKALRTQADVLNPSINWIPLHFTLANFIKAASLVEYGKTLVLTLRVTLISTLLSMISCSMAGYALGRYRIPLKKLWFVLIVLTVIVPAQTYLIPIFFQFCFFDFFRIGSLIGLFTGMPLTINMSSNEFSYYLMSGLGMGIRSGLYILIFCQFFRSMPSELENAARIDGCGETGTFVRIMLPNALSPYLVVFILSCVWYWNDTFFGTIMLRSKPMLANKVNNIQQLIQTSHAGSFFDMTEVVLIFAAAILFILPPLFMYLIAQKFFIQSMERSGIVG